MKNVSKRKMHRRIERIAGFITVDIWRIRLEDLPFGKSFLIRQLRVIALAITRFNEDRCFLRASSLTFYTLLSIVPVVAILFGISKGFGFEKILEKELLEQFQGHQEVVGKIIEFAQSLLQTTKGGLIAGIGLVILFWSVIKVLSHIEAALNEIWEVKKDRSWSRKFSDYTAVMLISPLLILLSSSATVFITSHVNDISNHVALFGLISPLIFSFLKLIPYILIWILFTVIYVFMPNTKVNMKSGVIAGLIACVIYQIAQIVYISFQIGASKYNAIYGSFAALPLFLMWVQISWWIVLFGAELSFANQNVHMYQYEPDFLKISPSLRKLLTLQAAHLLIRRFEEGEKPLTDSEISEELEIPARMIHRILFDLVSSGLFVETKTNDDKKFGVQPAMDISKLTIHSVLEALEHTGADTLPVKMNEEFEVLSDSLREFSKAMENSPANRLLKDL
ncbi:MAG TPA: YihY/virulence factor BrkB family protein [Deltaproteobacteria bacterium]|nr:YihY/virulence factor BrkB family protein [Deltaproteobacteria bacterium]HIJ42238.1 YihY/virulence factor BrkB family protein [Deltaproteobacteria bacterium]